MNLGFWNNFSPREKRIVTIALVFVAITITTGLAMLTPQTHQQAVDNNNEVNQTVTALQGLGTESLLTGIFGNNFFLTMIMFVPFIGPVIGFITFYNTGVVLESEAIARGYPPGVYFAAEFVLPIIWLEFIAYSTAIAASFWLSARMLQGSFRHEIINTAKFIAVCAVILLVSAVIETAIISAGF
jgi:uncharacterized membrane protein SpoIIM required for sporulation